MVVVLAVLAACGGDDDGATLSSSIVAAPTSTAAAATTTPGPLPTADELKAVLLTPPEVGPGFQGSEPVVDQRADVVAARPLCDIRATAPRVRVSVGPIVSTPEPKEQVFERITVEDNPSARLEVERRRSEARCEFQETASGGISYTVKVDGPVDVGSVGEGAVGLSQTYSKGYEGFRWDMTARQGRLVINVQYTSTSAVDPARARALLAAAVAKAASVR